jgi:hypothetical protein
MKKREEKTNKTETKGEKLRRKHLGEVPRRKNVCW